MDSVRKGWGLRTILLAAFIIVAMIIAALLTYNSRPPQFRRFVSQPLPDGTRYTFLYPAHLDRVNEGGGGSPEVTHSVNVTKGSWKNEVARDWARTRLGLNLPPDREIVTAVVIPINSTKVADSRSDARGSDGDRLWHNEFLVDARTKTKFALYHHCPKLAKAQFEASNPTIAKSFQVLPPGAAPPMP